ncbi:NlpC/P60 family protein [Actinacidiphila sp. bgisy167]|uniref:C40 family peptidase n=1 Tax=Actinacidiphila sp. bgisy167 TaxID=3413797 RepID=UPI003D72A5FA
MGSPAAAAAGIAVGLLVLILACTAALAGLLTGASPSAAPSRHALTDIPARMLTLYQQAAPECPGLPWTVLAAIGKVESDHGRHPTMTSSAGAVGPMQFLPATFAAYAHPVPPGGRNPPTPWDPVDAVHAAARLLCANGARNGRNLHRSIWHYNHSDTYVDHVLATARRYSAAEPAPTGAASKAVAFARAQLGTPYRWGGDGPTEGGFDCSGLTKAAYAAAGVHLPRVAQDQYNAGPRVPPGAPLLPGDLVFFGTDPRHITHVGIYTGAGRMLHAPRPGTTVREEPYRLSGSRYQDATRPSAESANRQRAASP